MNVSQNFLETYRVVRRAEGWGSADAAYYRKLPRVARDDPQRAIWRVRAATFRALLKVIGQHRRVLDLGAGNGWLAYQLTRRGHSVTALDLSRDERDGLGALRHYPATFRASQADFTALPFADAQFDCAIFNASLHYAGNLTRTMAESVRVLTAAGIIIVMDSPMYHDAASGQAMFAKKKAGFRHDYALDPVDDQMGFVTFADFEMLSRVFAFQWAWIEPFVDWRWSTRHWVARLRGQREPARFGLMVGRRQGD
ncbi:MAG: class I SAM-dependent methyltransferase [Chloroflexi bacterium]|nr:class I SAM-dependent methyltransferase [Chloroflexota bacterium]